MADDNKITYPAITDKNWFAIRRQFARTVPPQVTLSYLANLLDMSEESARANVMRALKATGLVDQDNKPTPRAFRWRDDDQYAEVCDEIRQEIYPDELVSLAPDTSASKDRVEKWFANKLRVGQSAARKFAAMYLLLTEADLKKGLELTTNSNAPKGGTKQRSPKPPKSIPTDDVPEPPKPASVANAVPPIPTESSNAKKATPSLHIDIQIHISPEATTDQIDQIFASMAKHLKDV